MKAVKELGGDKFNNYQPGYNRVEYLINSIYNL